MIRVNKNVLIIVGSPHFKNGNSKSISDCLFNKLNEKNYLVLSYI